MRFKDIYKGTRTLRGDILNGTIEDQCRFCKTCLVRTGSTLTVEGAVPVGFIVHPEDKDKGCEKCNWGGSLKWQS